MNRLLTAGGRMASGAGGAIAQRTVWPHRVVLASPPFDQDLQHPSVSHNRPRLGSLLRSGPAGDSARQLRLR